MIIKAVIILFSIVFLMMFFYFLFKKDHQKQPHQLLAVGGKRITVHSNRPCGYYVRGRHGKGFSRRR